jgi:hypothetical protein
MSEQIKDYHDLSPEEVLLINQCKITAIDVGALVETVKEAPGVDKRWVAIAATDLQKGFMALVRAIANPETF